MNRASAVQGTAFVKDELSYFDPDDILILERMQAKADMKKRQEYYEKRDYEPFLGKDGAWYVYLPDEKRGRKRVKRKERSQIIDVVVEYYKSVDQNPTVIQLFRRWNNERLKNNEIGKNSFSRYANDFKRFFLPGDDLCKKPIKQITEADLVSFIKLNIRRNGLTQKSYSGLRLLITGLFKYAKMLKMTEISISTFFADLSLSRNMFVKKHKKDVENVFSDDEAAKLIDYFSEHPTIHNLGLWLLFETGLRIGELCVLKPEHITQDGILVNSTEIYYKDPTTNKTVFEIKDSPKMGADDRVVTIPAQARTIIKRIRMLDPSGEYLFTQNGKRIISTRFNYHLYKACDSVGIPRRSTHKIRKTYASRLIDSQVEDSIIKEQLGHTNIETTREYYYYTTQDKKYREQQIQRAISY